MRKLSESGEISGLTIAFTAVCVALVVVIIFAAMAYSGEKKYKNNANQLIASAVSASNNSLENKLNAKFQQEQNATVTSYTGPSQYGSVSLQYPKSWSGYADTAGSNPLDAYFSPGVVPSVEDQSNIFALRIEVVGAVYSDTLAQYSSMLSNSQSGQTVTITPYTLKNLPNVVGVMITGEVQPSKQGVMVMFPLRTNTLEIWTESSQYTSLFTSQILNSVTFQP